MQISKLDYIQWRDSPVTTAFMQQMLIQLDDIKGYLFTHAGKEPIEDRRLVGIIEGAQWLLDWEPNFQEDTEDATESDGV